MGRPAHRPQVARLAHDGARARCSGPTATSICTEGPQLKDSGDLRRSTLGSRCFPGKPKKNENPDAGVAAERLAFSGGRRTEPAAAAASNQHEAAAASWEAERRAPVRCNAGFGSTA